MDLDPSVEPELDHFSTLLPLPFRVATTVVLGVWAWGLNLEGLERAQIDVPELIRYPPRASHAQISSHQSTYRFATVLSIPLAISLLLFWLITRFRSASVVQWEIIPNLYLLFLVVAFAYPSRIAQNGRRRFLLVLRRVSIGGIAETGDGRFGDILMADVLTSYAKVLADLFVALCMMVSRQHSTAKPDRGCGGTLVVPILLSIPSLIRLRQCMVEYFRVRRTNMAGGLEYGSQGWGGQHLANALKYASAFPVIVLSSLKRGSDPANIGLTENTLRALWFTAVFLNSFYSFYWDVAKDWDLHLFSRSALRAPPPLMLSATNNQSAGLGRGKVIRAYPYGLRKQLYFGDPYIYYTVIFIDLVLRCTWSFKLSPHLDHFGELEGGIWVMELLEVIRRWIWVFFRVETEMVRFKKRQDEGRGMLLADFQHEVDVGGWDEDSDRDP